MLCRATEALQWGGWQARSGSWVWGLAWILGPHPPAPTPPCSLTMKPPTWPDLAPKPPSWLRAWVDGGMERGKKACSWMCSGVRRGGEANNAIRELASVCRARTHTCILLCLSLFITALHTLDDNKGRQSEQNREGPKQKRKEEKAE